MIKAKSVKFTQLLGGGFILLQLSSLWLPCVSLCSLFLFKAGVEQDPRVKVEFGDSICQEHTSGGQHLTVTWDLLHHEMCNSPVFIRSLSGNSFRGLHPTC